ncbi:pre-mRNA-splicing factor 38A [Trypanosoma conorhini]|uniref:Pre-mRNA-splicing factor 38 n=1 Tax=Trypanosoma conorhini TaxID=83891 RepID=A0A3R7RDQ4_9TRYP|nr:pre-mRNA-splicing factor 38A [Trypanosoma conorhini]RNF00537.1 pre-mRNA-splicing factor 38A [Trypanosoma conorhini]
MELQKRMAWNLKGRSAVAALDPPTRHRILQSNAMTSCVHKPLLATIEAIITLQCVGGLSGPLQRPEPFICLVARLLQITPDPSVVLAMLHQDVHKYLRVAALFVIRLIGNEAMMREAMRVGWDDYRKIRVYGYVEDWGVTTCPKDGAAPGEAEEGFGRTPSYGIMCVDEITDRLFNVGARATEKDGESSSAWLGLRFSPMLL